MINVNRLKKALACTLPEPKFAGQMYTLPVQNVCDRNTQTVHLIAVRYANAQKHWFEWELNL